jgi:hypothetical protein
VTLVNVIDVGASGNATAVSVNVNFAMLKLVTPGLISNVTESAVELEKVTPGTEAAKPPKPEIDPAVKL